MSNYNDRTVEFGPMVPTVEELGEILAAIEQFNEAEENGIIVSSARIGDKLSIDRCEASTSTPDEPIQWEVRRLTYAH